MVQDPNETPDAIRVRLIRLRLALHRTQTGMAKLLEISTSRWSNYTRTGLLSREMARRLCRKVPGLTQHWLYHGDARGMPRDLFDDLEAVQMPADEPNKPKRGRKPRQSSEATDGAPRGSGAASKPSPRSKKLSTKKRA